MKIQRRMNTLWLSSKLAFSRSPHFAPSLSLSLSFSLVLLPSYIVVSKVVFSFVIEPMCLARVLDSKLLTTWMEFICNLATTKRSGPWFCVSLFFFTHFHNNVALHFSHLPCSLLSIDHFVETLCTLVMRDPADENFYLKSLALKALNTCMMTSGLLLGPRVCPTLILLPVLFRHGASLPDRLCSRLF